MSNNFKKGSLILLSILSCLIMCFNIFLYFSFRHTIPRGNILFINFDSIWYLLKEKLIYLDIFIVLLFGLLFILSTSFFLKLLNFIIFIVSIIYLHKIDVNIQWLQILCPCCQPSFNQHEPLLVCSKDKWAGAYQQHFQLRQ